MKMIAVVEVMDCEGDIFGSSFLFDSCRDCVADLVGLCFCLASGIASWRLIDLYVPSPVQLSRPRGLRGFDYDFIF
jgi:hypothetical protein